METFIRLYIKPKKSELKLDPEKIKQNQSEINTAFTDLFEKVDNLISEMKLQSSEEILNGSIEKAQKLLQEIMPYQTFYVKLKETKSAFDAIGQVSPDEIEKVKEKIETLDQEQIDKEVKQANEGSDITSPINFRIPILKALIYLGGSSEEVEVMEFVKKEMKGKLSKKDLEVPKDHKNEIWLDNLYTETATMVDEGLLSREKSDKNWEIAQKGIDYLSKYAK